MDSPFGQLSSDDYQQILFFMGKDTGLKAIICIHNPVIGLALGVARMYNYACEWDALSCMLLLSCE
jgi:leucine dehydrogenase